MQVHRGIPVSISVDSDADMLSIAFRRDDGKIEFAHDYHYAQINSLLKISNDVPALNKDFFYAGKTLGKDFFYWLDKSDGVLLGISLVKEAPQEIINAYWKNKKEGLKMKK